MVAKQPAGWRKKSPTQKSRLRQNVESIGLALLIALAVRSSMVQAFWVPSASMEPTIEIGDHIFVNKLAYAIRLPLIGTELARTGEPQRRDVVVFVSPVDRRTDLIKRIVAVAGDTVEIRNKRLFVNGQAVPDLHAHFVDDKITNDHRDNLKPTVVPEGKFFVLGDNRDRSYDSRYWGVADVSDIKGKATFIYWSRDSEACSKTIRRDGFLSALRSGACSPHWSRFGHFIS